MLKVESQKVSNGNEWLSLSEVARRTGVSVASVCRKVKQLEQSGLLTSRLTGAGGSRLVDLDEFIRVQESMRDAVQTANSAPKARRRAEARDGAVRAPAAREMATEVLSTPLQDAQVRRTRVDAELKELLLKQKLGELSDTIAVREAMATAGGVIARGCDQFHMAAVEIGEAFVKGGEQAARAVAKAYGRTMRQRFAAEMRLLARGADGEEEAAAQDAS